jgi:nucleoside-diphosphate-sugar epimerase
VSAEGIELEALAAHSTPFGMLRVAQGRLTTEPAAETPRPRRGRETLSSPRLILFRSCCKLRPESGNTSRSMATITQLLMAPASVISFILALQTMGQAGMRAYNIGAGTPHSVREVHQEAEKVTGRKVPVRVAARRSGDPAALHAGPRRIMKELGWKPQHSSLQEILASHGIGSRSTSGKTLRKSVP